jgi:hypothetical protein
VTDDSPSLQMTLNVSHHSLIHNKTSLLLFQRFTKVLVIGRGLAELIVDNHKGSNTFVLCSSKHMDVIAYSSFQVSS